MMNNKEINIFIENEYPTFDMPKDSDIKDIKEKAISMMQYFLKNQSWVDNSCLNEYTFDNIYFDIVFTNNTKIQEINKEYRHKDAPTDVITFAIFADSPKEERFIFDNEINLGEMIISLDKTIEQTENASHHNHTFERELLFLIAHGILHLLGYDHQDENSLQKMWNMQQEMLDN